MGAWSFIEPNMKWVLEHVGGKVLAVKYAGRGASASTATGLLSKHIQEQKALVADALGAKERGKDV